MDLRGYQWLCGYGNSFSPRLWRKLWGFAKALGVETLIQLQFLKQKIILRNTNGRSELYQLSSRPDHWSFFLVAYHKVWLMRQSMTASNATQGQWFPGWCWIRQMAGQQRFARLAFNWRYFRITVRETFNSKFLGQCGQHRIRMDRKGISI